MVKSITRMKLKICLVGERGVGKTSLLNRYVFNTFESAYHGTLGSKLTLLSFKKVVSYEDLVEAEIALFDLMGERGVRDAFKDVMFWGAHGFIAVADIARSDTIRALPSWVDAVKSVAGDVPFRLLINKSDLVPNAVIDPRDTKWLLSEFPDAAFNLTSAKTCEGVAEAFDSLIESIVKHNLAKSKAKSELETLSAKIMEFVRRRGVCGVSNTDLLQVFRNIRPDSLLREVEDLRVLGLVSIEQRTPGSFLIRLTEKGEREMTERKTTRTIEEHA